MVVTNRGPIALQDAFELGEKQIKQPGGDDFISYWLEGYDFLGWFA